TNQTGLGDRPIPFTEWVQLTYGSQVLPYYDQPKMFMPQMDWITDAQGQIIVDFVGRFENLKTDFAEVCARIGCEATLPHLKKSERGNFRQYYDDATRAIIARWFARDIETFGYRFD
ncbi:MAG TPA: sulfotransferase family 2 domain-containing protein, partial [Longimicrobiales bacterium]|nr:sulfotransferase family 2 domain-containing protein [Longimicrobiales bacterium]